MNRNKVKCGFVVVFFLLTIASPLLIGDKEPRQEISSLGQALASSHQKVKPNWNKEHYNWKEFEDENGKVPVIIALDESQFSNLDKRLQKELIDKKERTFKFAFSGISAKLDRVTIEQILGENPAIQIQPDYEMRAFVAVNQTGADAMWNRTDDIGNPIKGDNVVVAIIDTGIDYNHPALGAGFGPSYRVIGGYDFYNNDANPMDDNGHGTHCAGIVGANGTIFGVAPNVEFLAYKVLGSSGSGPVSVVIEGIERALDPNDDNDTSDHADVINLSLGGPGWEDDAACLAVNNAVDLGVVVCVASGNSGPVMMTIGSPGLAEKVITIGAVDSSGVVASFSSRGPTENLNIKPELSAPGVSIYSTYVGSTYKSMSGTSMSTPHVAGAAALLIQSHPDWTPSEIKSSLVTQAAPTGDSLWLVGSGQLWIPGGDDADVFLSKPIFSGGIGGMTVELIINNIGATAIFAGNSSDWRGLLYNSSYVPVVYSNLSSLDLASFEILTGESLSVNLSISVPPVDADEGYYEGSIHIVNGTRDVHVQFGYVVLCYLRVHVRNLIGAEVTDSDGMVYVYSIPDVNISVADTSAPPASFLLPAGTYSVHSVGHGALYVNDDPYALSIVVELSELGATDIYLNMTSAHRMVLNLETDEGWPIYVDHYWVYVRYVGEKNVSFHLFSIEDEVMGNDFFSLPRSRTIYVSDTNVTVGIAIAGYAYSAPMYDFFYRNWNHWYDVAGSTATDFRIEASADQEYLLSWEFDGVNSSTSNMLALEDGGYCVFETKYDLPGVVDPVVNIGSHLSLGTGSNQYLRRDTGTSIPPLFSGMTRQIFVQGVFEEYYTSGYLRDTAFDQQYFIPNYNELVNYSYDTNLIYLPDRNFLEPVAPSTESYRVGQGPFYPSVRTMNTNDSLAIVLPILREQSGAKVVGRGIAEPDMLVYQGTSLLGTYHLSEFQRALDAMRIVSLPGAGSYKALIYYNPGCQICDETVTTLGFTVPSTDRNPPQMTALNMSDRFVPGDVVPIAVNVTDDVAVSSVMMNWRNDSTESWRSLTVTGSGTGWYNASIFTGSLNTSIHLKVNVTDSSGNYLEYQATHASLNETPISFALSLNQTEFAYTNQATVATITGYLLNGSNPLSLTRAVPIELRIENQTKVAMVLDEYIVMGAHSHNGTIRFDWTFNPIYLFSSANQSVNLTAVIDLGIYEVISQSIALTSIVGTDLAPIVTLKEPANNTKILNGTQIHFTITDENLMTANYSWDNGTPYESAIPYLVETWNQTEGYHWIRVNATDNMSATTTHSYRFYVDVTEPSLSVTWPTNGTSIGTDGIVTISASDPSTMYVYWEADYGTRATDASPYGYSVSSLAVGEHNLTCLAYDQFGHYRSAWVNFNITSSAPTITNSPGIEGVVGSEYSHNSTCTAADSGSNTWNLNTDATWLNLNYSDQTHGFVNGTPSVSGDYWVNLSVSDDDSGSYTNYTLTILEADPPPTITSSPLLGVWEDHDYSYDADADQPVSWALESNGTWLSIDSGTGIVSGNPNNSFSEMDLYANVSCTNANGTAYQNYSVHVWNLQPAFTPDIGIPPGSGVVGGEIYYDANHSDEGVGTPPGNFTDIETNFTGSYSFNHTDGALVFTPLVAGSIWWNITGDDQRGVDNSTNYQNWTVDISEKAPYILSSPVASTIVWELFYFNCSAALPDSGITIWNHTSNATWLSFVWGNQTRYNVSGTPVILGSYWLNFSVSDSDSDHCLNFSFSVVAGPAPVFASSPPLIAYEDNLYFYQAVCDDHIDTWSLLFNNATWCSWNPANGSFMGTPDNSNVRDYYSLYISATNMNGTEWQNWWMSVENRIPVWSTSPIIAVVNGTAYSYNSTTDDEGVGNTTYSVNSNASFAYNIHALTGEVTFTPDLSGTIWVNITCNDGMYGANSSWYQNYSVLISNSTPLITNLPSYLSIAWILYYFNATSTLPDVGVNIWILTTDALWIIEGDFGQTYKNISGYPDILGVFWFNISVSDGDSSSYINWSINVLAGPHPNIISSPPLGVTEDNLYFYLPVADQPVTWVLVWADGTWLAFDPANGSLMGIPDNTEAEFGFNIWLRAETMNGSDTDMWGIFVYNNPPLFTTTPADLNSTIGGTFIYDPSTTDESVGPTVYTVTTNTTDWYTIDATSGQLIFAPTVSGSWWFDIVFDDFSGVANSTVNQNTTITVATLPVLGPPSILPSIPSLVSASFEYVITGTIVFFTDSSHGSIAQYLWDFGDGVGSTKQSPAHKYASTGIYTVILTVYDSEGHQSKAEVRINVGLSPETPIERNDQGWDVYVSPDLVVSVSALGLLVFGAITYASGIYMPSSSLFTAKGRKVIGFLMVGFGIYYFIFVNNSWWNV